jgi:hypothetical protein
MMLPRRVHALTCGMMLAAGLAACDRVVAPPLDPTFAPPAAGGPLPAPVPGMWSVAPEVLDAAPAAAVLDAAAASAAGFAAADVVESGSQTADGPWVTSGWARPDLVWHHTDGRLSVVTTSGYYLMPTVNPQWQIMASADFNRDGSANLVWFDAARGMTSIWLAGPESWAGLPVVPLGWVIAAAADFNGDGYPDLVWQHVETGQRSIWFMNGTEWTGSYALLPTVPPHWHIAAAGDLTGDGQPDLIWENRETGERVVWHMSGPTWPGTYTWLPHAPTNWRIVAAGDFTGNALADLILVNTAGSAEVWVMDGTRRVTTAPMGNAPGWSLRTALNRAPLVRVCSTGQGAVPTVGSPHLAAQRVASRGTIRFCPGVYTLEGSEYLELRRPVTIEAEPGPRPELQGRWLREGVGTRPIISPGHAPGSFRIRGLRISLTGGGSAIWIGGFAGTSVEIRDVEFVLDSSSSAISISTFATSAAEVVVRDIVVTGGRHGVALPGPAKSIVLTSRFTGVAVGGIEADVVWGNDLDGCGREYCIEGGTWVVGNSMRGASGVGIRVRGAARVENNLVEGALMPGDPSDRLQYAFREGAIRVDHSTCAMGAVHVTGNLVRNAGVGYAAQNTASGCEQIDMVGAHNRAHDVHTAAATFSGGRIALQQSDFTGWVRPMDMILPPTGVATLRAGDLTCNWWGAETGPNSVPDAVPPEVYTPFATAAIANSRRTC